MNWKFLPVFLLAGFCGLAAAQTSQPGAVPADTDSALTNDAPKPPGAKFTNSVEMELLKISDTFWAGKYEVTQKEYQKIMGSNPSNFQGERQPVDSVSWNDAVEFCRRMTENDLKEKKLPEGYLYTLPTEDEWEHFAAGVSLDDAITSFNSAPRAGTSQVGTLNPNGFGMYDVRGNVMEFCDTDPSQPFRILRGGSWQDFIEINLRVAFRYYAQPDERKNTFGFRVVLRAKSPAGGATSGMQ